MIDDILAKGPIDDLGLRHLLHQRPQPLVVPRSGFVAEARGIHWDLRGERPRPLDYAAPFETHLNLEMIKKWREDWPDYPDQEIFSHLLEGVRFKADMAFQLVLQPHLSSLPNGFVNVHRELCRLMEKGFFESFRGPPFAPWNTLPMGVAFRKLEPDRPRRTTDGGAPRQGSKGSEFLIDDDGVRAIPLNVIARWPADDLQRGTCEIFYSRWAARLSKTPGSVAPDHLVTSAASASSLAADDACEPCAVLGTVLSSFRGPASVPTRSLGSSKHAVLRL
jgi:hypothetical protein